MSDQITIRDVYDAQQGLGGKVDAISVQVAAFTARVDQRLDHGQGQLGDHEKRIRILEAARWKIAGASVVLGVLAGGGAAWVALVVTRH